MRDFAGRMEPPAGRRAKTRAAGYDYDGLVRPAGAVVIEK
jgi:hypothetical protein